MNNKEQILSIFVDESGDSGDYNKNKNVFSDKFYIITFVFHEQKNDISPNIKYFENKLAQYDYYYQSVHCGPLIRREYPFEGFKAEDIRHILNALNNFSRKLPINCYSVIVDKSINDDLQKLNKAIHNEVQQMINDNYNYFHSFNKIIIYYDNGQEIVSRALKNTFETEFDNIDRRKVKPKEYRLLQVADLFCTITLMELKRQKYHFSSSEKAVFSANVFKKQFLNTIRSKKL